MAIYHNCSTDIPGSGLQMYYPTEEKYIHIYGRTFRKDGKFIPLFWTGSGVEFCTDSGEVWMELESEYAYCEEWLRVEVDGVCMQRLIVPKGRHKLCVFRGFSGDRIRTVRILKETQPKQEDADRFLLVHSLYCDGSLYAVKKKRLKLEFIGDSLTSGEGLSGAEELKCFCSGVFGLEGHYGLRTADYLEADFRILSQSGWGVYCSWDNNLNHSLPGYYEQVCGVMEGSKNIALGAQERYSFVNWQPDAVIINLGSNDGFALDNPAWKDPKDGSEWKLQTKEDGMMDEASQRYVEEAVISFLEKIRKNNPDSWLLWAYGMIDHRIKACLEEAVDRYRQKSKDKRVDFISLPAMSAEWIGSNNHPGKESHRVAAETLIRELEKRLL